MTHQLKCMYCGKEISLNRDYQRVTGFEKRRNQGGTNALRLREPQEEWACMFCVDRQAAGLNVNQEGLFG